MFKRENTQYMQYTEHTQYIQYTQYIHNTDTHMTYKRGVGKGRPDISILVELTVLSQLWKTKKSDNFQLVD